MSDPVRDVVFISHATPQDNDFVKWLGARLIGLGYNVWADVFELKGGTPFWNTIEEAITIRAIKVIFVASTESVKPDRKGVRDELAAADITGRRLKDAAFIIPVRLDKVDFGSFPIQLLQLNALDFSSGWGGMLVGLVETLEKANVPTDRGRIDERMACWKERTGRDVPKVEAGPELLLTNLLPIAALPTQINFYEFNGPNTEINKALDATGIPYSRHQRLVLSFGAIDEFQADLPLQFTLKLDRRVETERFLKGRQGNETAPEWFDARNMMTFLLRRHVERFLESKGIKAHDTSRGLAFYFPLDLIPDGKVRYRTPDGKQTWKKVTGRSDKLQLNWHLSMLVNIDLGPPGFIRFKPYICFSEGTGKPIDDPKRVSGIRRRFCKSWWNRHWRQLYQAFIAFLGGGEEILIELDGTEVLKLSGGLLQLTGARRLVGDTELDDVPDEPEEPDDDEVDDLDPIQFEPDEEDAA
jgi:hypothetical protein